MQEIGKQKEYIEKINKLNNNKALKYYILTMGCSLNENDSEKLSGIIEKAGYTKTMEMQDADLIIFNTCCIRENAEDKLFGKLGEVKKLKEQKNVILAIGGCMMQEEHIIQKLKQSYPFFDIVFGTHTLHKFAEDLYIYLSNNKQINDVIDIDGEVYEGLPIKRTNQYKALVTIMYGCNNFCSYCIVPYVRGRERSRKPNDILTEINELAEQGYKEITLLGQNVNSYRGNEDGNIYTFAMLLEKICEVDNIEKIRFISPHPKDFTDDVIDVIAKNKKICKLIHLPLQSGSSDILNKMNRKYTKEQYLDLVQKMKNKIPNITFSTDIIVGFPEEAEKDFLDTLDVVKKVNFEQVYMFIYSRRVGTPADKMENQVQEEVKHERFNRLKQLVESQINSNNIKYINTYQEVLVEGYSKNNPNMLSGRTDTNKVVIFDGNDDLIGKIVNLKIVSEHMWYLKGEII